MKYKNTINEARFWFLIYQKEDGFVGICRETGYVEEGETAKEVFHRLSNGTRAIMLELIKNPSLLPSINNEPPFKYRVLFYWIPFWYGIKNFFTRMPGEIELIDRTVAELNKDYSTCVV